MIMSTPSGSRPGQGRPRDLTWSQRLLWTGQALHPETPLYNMALAFDIQGPLDLDAFDKAFQAVLNGCDALRTTFESKDGEPLRRVRAPYDFRSERLDWSGVEPGEREKLLAIRAAKLFDLGGRLFDSVLIRTDDGHTWFLNQHHLITDAWACSVIYKAVSEAYCQLRNGTLGATFAVGSYETFVEHERSIRGTERHEAARRHWASRQADVLPVPMYGGSDTRASTRTERVSVALGRQRSEAIRTLARSASARTPFEDLSVFNVLMGALASYLHRVSGESRISVGTPSHNRTTNRLKATAGVCIEVFPLTVEVPEGATFDSVLDAVRRESLTFLKHAMPGASTASGNRSVNAVLNFIPSDFAAFDTMECRTSWVHPGHGDRAHDLRLQVHDFDQVGELVLHFDLSVERFAADRRAAVPQHFLAVLDAMLAQADQPVAAPPLTSSDELAALDRLAGYSPAGSAEDRTNGHDTVVARFLQVCRRHRDDDAVHFEGGAWTYGELRTRVEEAAQRLTRLGIGGKAVALATGRSPEAIVGILAALRAGAWFVPLDLQDPDARISSLLKETEAAAILVREGAAVRGGATPVVRLAGPGTPTPRTGTAEPDSATSIPLGVEDPAYVLYTSGSTGRPKGVQVSHGALAAYATWASEYYAGGQPRRFALFTPISFDLTLTSIFAPLLSGGTVVVHGGEEGTVDSGLTSLAGGRPVDVVKLTPAHLRALVGTDLRHLGVRVLIVGGEELTVAVAGQALAIFGEDVRLYNEYGPTEATVGCTVHRFDPDVDRGRSVPIGRPLPHAVVQVVDSMMRPVPRGVPGEIVVGGAGLANGYLHQPAETSTRFVPEPRDRTQRLYRTGDLGRWTEPGTLEYLGRADRQVKIHGVRVELGEIEVALDGHPEIETVVVDLRKRRGAAAEETRWCAECGLPSAYPGAELDDSDVCSICRGFRSYRSRVEDYFGTMEDLARIFSEPGRVGGGEFDCLLMLSGGKDSSYALYRLVEMGLAVTTLTLDNGFISDQAKDNVRRITSELGVPHEFATSQVMNRVFAASLEKHANVCNGCFKTMYTIAFNKALDAGIPFVVTGLSRGQLFETRLTEELFQLEGANADAIDGLVLEARKAYHRADDAVNELLDNSRLKSDEAYERVRFLDFYRYCDVPLDDMYAFLEERAPWIRPADTGRSTNCLINEAGIWVHKAQRGYHNYALPYSWDVRMGHKTRAAALMELDDEIDEDRVAEMLARIGYSVPVGALDAEGVWLTAYYVAGSELDAAHLRAYLTERLPRHMIPNRFVRISAIPLTRNGKLDREALPDPSLERPRVGPAYHAPASPLEERLAELWARALDLDRVGVHDNFFDLGGDSITAIRIGAGAREHELNLDPNAVFRHQTVSKLAEYLSAQTGERRLERRRGQKVAVPTQLPVVGAAEIDQKVRSRVEELLRRADRKSE